MKSIQFPEANAVFTKPEGMTDEQCSDLPVWKGKTTEDVPVIISCWKLSAEDLERIVKDGVVYLSITGTGMPPVCVFTEKPWINISEPENSNKENA